MNNAAYDDFSDMDDLDFAEVRDTPSTRIQTQTCPVCSGRGVRSYGYTRVVDYPCSPCRGTGQVTGERIRRYEGAKKAARTAANNLANKQAQLRKDYPAEIQWLYDSAGFEFADSLRDQFESYGKLSEKQLAAVTNCIAKVKARMEAKRIEREANAPTVAGAAAVMEAFRQAQANNIKRPKMRFEQVKFSLAPESGRNAGSIYVTFDEEYVGKITDGRFLATRDGDRDDVKAALAPIFANPLEAAVAYGKKVGVCSCCGRELTDPVSIERGIGPICADNFF